MPAPFADAQARINDAVVEHLSNKSFVIKGVSVDGVFDKEFITVNFNETSKPVFSCKEIPGLVHGDTAISGATTYKIQGIQPDGLGMVKLILEEQ